MMIRIPFSGDAESTAPLRVCIQRTADAMGVSPHHAALLMSHFFEAVAEQVAKNRAVRIPGFGIVGAKAWFPRNDPDAPGYCYPAFSAASPFRNLVRAECPPSGPAMDAIDRHRKHNHPTSHQGRASRMPFSTHRAFREQIRAQARRVGFDL